MGSRSRPADMWDENRERNARPEYWCKGRRRWIATRPRLREGTGEEGCASHPPPVEMALGEAHPDPHSDPGDERQLSLRRQGRENRKNSDSAHTPRYKSGIARD